MVYFISAVGAYIVVFFPFAMWARHITRQDALSTVEAYILGQSCGPVGVWLVMRENKKAEAKAYRAGLLVEHVRTAPEPDVAETPHQMEQRLKAAPPPLLNATAYRARQDLKPAAKAAEMPTFTMNEEVRPAPAPHQPRPLQEPVPSPPVKAGIAWRQPHSADPSFMHSDERPPQADGAPVDG
jgi:hypothetical protein